MDSITACSSNQIKKPPFARSSQKRTLLGQREIETAIPLVPKKGNHPINSISKY
jgi:hypothetical protein